MCYTFNELSEEAKANAIENFRDIESDWYKGIYYDAELIGLIITDFDLSSNTIKGKLDGTVTLKDVKKEIIDRHGVNEGTYKLALEFSNVEDEDAGIEFKRALLEEYLTFFKQEFEYLHSDERIVEDIIANSVPFDVEGGLA